MPESLYSIEKMNINGYEAYFLTVTSKSFFTGEKHRFIPAMAQYINDKKNPYVKIKKFPAKIDSTNFFYFIHAQEISKLQEFIRVHPDINLYLEKLKEYLKSHK